MLDKRSLGKLKNDKVFRSFNSLSDECYEFLANNFPFLKVHELSSELSLLYRFIYQAESTSKAIRLLLSNAFILPTLILIRIRMEQVIIFSYLLNEEPKIGIESFVKFLPSKNTQLIKSVLNNEDLSPYGKSSFLKHGIDIDKVSNTIDFEYVRNWTKLDLYSMAKKRDELVLDDKTLEKSKLATDYSAFYKMFSSLVHCDISALTDDFTYIKTKKVDGEIFSTIFQDEFYYNLALSLISQYDIIQIYEFFKFLKTEDKEFTDKQLKVWNKNLKKYILKK